MVCRSLILSFQFLSFIFPFHDCFTGEVIEYIDPDSCEDYEYFSITKLQCIPCDPDYYLQPKENKRACECEDNSLVISNVGEWPKCRPCPAKHRPSMDRRKCIPCLQSLSSKSNDTACEFCAVDEIQVDKEANGDWLKVSKCIQCNAGTIPSADWTSCIPCPFEVPLDGDGSGTDDVYSTNCSCPTDTHELLQHGQHRLLCISRKDLIEWPDELASYTIKYNSGNTVISRYLQENLRPAAYLCMDLTPAMVAFHCHQTSTEIIPAATLLAQSLLTLSVMGIGVAKYHLLASVKSEEQACQELANMCTLTGYQMVTNPVLDVRRRVFGTQKSPAPPNPCQPFQPSSASADQLPWIFYGEGEASAAIARKKITAQYRMESKNTWLNITTARYSPDGTLLGLGPATLPQLSLCPDAAVINSQDFFRFGVPNKLSCKLPLRAVMNRTTEFLDLFLSYQDGSTPALYALPILSLNVQLDGSPVNKGNEESQWQLVRRILIFDRMSGVKVGSESVSVIRYMKSFHIRVKLRGREEEGLIYPPLIKVQYGEVDLEDGNPEQIFITTTFSIDYEQPDGFLIKPVEIWSGILGALAVLIAFIQAWSSIRRDSITLPSSAAAPVWFVRCLCLHAAGRLADAALIIASIASVRTLVLYKEQSVPHITLPVASFESVSTDNSMPAEDGLIKTYIIVAFSLKCIEIIHMLVCQGSVDIFFLDWERPRPSGTSYYSSDSLCKRSLGGSQDASPTPQPVSAWRMCFVANEWNELQAMRRTSTLFQIVGALYFLKVLQFENWAANHPELSREIPDLLKDSPPSLICHVAVGVIFYIIVYLGQIILVKIYEHYGKNSIQEFVDLCSMANISVLIFPWLYFGFYVHGRSAHGFADTDMASLKECLRKEAEDSCGTRGLIPDGLERQTFRIAVPPAFRTCYDRLLSFTVSSAANISSSVMGGAYPGTRRGSPPGIWRGRGNGNGVAIPGPSSGFVDGNDQAFQGMNKFLSAFLEHALKEIDYEVRDKLFMESLLDMEMTEPLEYGIFYNDNGHSFDQVLLYGNELTLAAFNLLTFMFVDAIFLDYVLAGIVTVIIDKVIVWIRRVSGKRNISKKALIDQRFLI